MLERSRPLAPRVLVSSMISLGILTQPLATAGQVTGQLDVAELQSEVFDNTRLLRIWLPPGYEDEENQRTTYPVIYLNDGQNLFDAATSTFSAHEWRADEVATDLIQREVVSPFVIVGIDHAGRRGRAREYLPYPDESLKPPEPDPQGRRYGEFLERDVLPFVETRYRVSDSREGRFLGGSSYGALVALYVASSHPHLFSGLLLESPSFYVDQSHIFREVDPARLRLDRVVLGVGTNELGLDGCPEDDSVNREAVHGVLEAAELFRAAGLEEPRRLRLFIDECATHGEEAWAQRIGPALTFLMTTR